MSMTRTRAWVAGTVVLCILLGVASYFLLVGPKRAEAAQTNQQTADTVASNAALRSQVDQLAAQFADLPSQQAELAAIKQAIPEEAAIPTLVRDLDSLATASGVTVMSLTPGTGAVVVDPTATAAAAPVAGTTDTTGSTDPAAATTTAATPAGDVLVSIPVSVVFLGSFAEAELYIKKVQTELSRAFLITDLAITAQETATEATGGAPAVAPGDVSVSMSGAVFVLRPAAAAVVPVTAAGTTAPATTDTASAPTN